METMTLPNKRLKPPPNVLNGLVWDCLSEPQQFILSICLLHALHSDTPGTFLLSIDHFDRYTKYYFDRGQVRKTLYALQTHEILSISTFESMNAYLITIQNWDSYEIITQ